MVTKMRKYLLVVSKIFVVVGALVGVSLLFLFGFPWITMVGVIGATLLVSGIVIRVLVV